MTKLRIYINGRFLTRPISGVERFSIEICNELIKLDSSIKIIAPKKAKNQKWINESNVLYVGKFSGHFWEQITLPFLLKRKRSPLLLNLANMAPLLYANKIVTLHDIAFKDHPEWFNPIFSIYYSFLIPFLLKTSKHILTVSEFSKTKIHETYKISNHKISVAYNGLSQSFLAYIPGNNPYDFKYMLTVGSFQPRKNLLRLLEAYQQINMPKPKLIVVGTSNKVFKSICQDLDFFDQEIIIKENVSDNELCALYSHAEKFIFPSLYEGFGLPIIEALHFSCPVIASDIPVFRELFADLITYFNPYDIEDIKRALVKKAFLKEMVELKNQIKKYKFDVSAKKIIGIIETV